MREVVERRDSLDVDRVSVAQQVQDLYFDLACISEATRRYERLSEGSSNANLPLTCIFGSLGSP